MRAMTRYPGWGKGMWFHFLFLPFDAWVTLLFGLVCPCLLLGLAREPILFSLLVYAFCGGGFGLVFILFVAFYDHTRAKTVCFFYCRIREG